MDKSSLKQSLLASYGQLATEAKKSLLSKVFPCCSDKDERKQIGQHIGYSSQELHSVPKGSNLGVGCGNPSALAVMKEGETVVDFGSGAGFDAFIVASKVGERGTVIGIDLSQEMIDLARANALKGNYAHVEFIHGDIEQVPLDDNMADHIISNCVINLSFHKSTVFKEAYRILKPGGTLSISDMVLEKELPPFIKNALAGYVACISGTEREEDYIRYAREAGFTEINIISKAQFPLELMLTDPQLSKLAQTLGISLNSQEAKKLASNVSSISMRAKK